MKPEDPVTYVSKETQGSIAKWADATFGPAKSLASITARANREMAELVQAAIDGADDRELSYEAADVAICLFRYAQVCGGQPLKTYVAPPTSLSAKIDLALGASTALRDLIRDSLRTTEAAVRLARAACVLNYLRHLCRECDANIDFVVDKKMEINRARKWRLDGRGHGSHVEGT